MAKITHHIIHCSASPFGDYDVIRKWHVEERGWKDVAYHNIILNGNTKSIAYFESDLDGLIQSARPLDGNTVIEGAEISGSGALGMNNNSIGTCVIGGYKGEFDFTTEQYRSLVILCTEYVLRYPHIKTVGHNELPNVNKACPVISMEALRQHITDLLNNGGLDWQYALKEAKEGLSGGSE